MKSMPGTRYQPQVNRCEKTPRMQPLTALLSESRLISVFLFQVLVYHSFPITVLSVYLFLSEKFSECDCVVVDTCVLNIIAVTLHSRRERRLLHLLVRS
mgnify:CR=1 FL=1|jgi:hypothetical protein